MSKPHHRPDWVFTWSTPAPNVDGSIPDPWRCAHADRMREVALALNPDAYTEYASDEGGIWVGLKSNLNPKQHEEQIIELLDLLKSAAFHAAPVTRNHRVIAIIVRDQEPK